MTLEKAASAGFWSMVDIVSRQGVTFLVTIVLARLLTPSDFGIVAFVSLFSGLAIASIQGGISAAIIQRQTITSRQESALFWWNLGTNAAAALIVAAVGPLLAAYYEQPVLAPMMIVAATHIALSSLTTVQNALLVRQLRFALLAKMGLASSVASGALAIAAAAMGAGIWALAIQLISSAILNSVLVWWITDWRPGRHASPSTLRPLFAFSSLVGLSSFLEVLYSQGFALVIAKRYGPGDVGLYNRATAAQLIVSSAFASVIGRVALPLLSQRSDDPDALRRAMRRAISLAMIVNVPAMTGLAVLPDLAIVTLFGNQWVRAAPLLSILAIGGILIPIHAINLQLLLAQGGASYYFKIEVTKKIVGIVFVLFGSMHGIIGLAYAQLAVSLASIVPNTFLTSRSIGYGIMSQLTDIIDLFFCSAVMAICLLLIRPYVDLSPVPSFFVLVAVGAGIYVAAGLILKLRSFREAFEVGRILILRRRQLPVESDTYGVQ